MNEDVQALGKRIRRLRIAKGYTSATAFAQAYDIPAETYARYEAGADMLLTEIFAIAQALGMSLQEFFEG